MIKGAANPEILRRVVLQEGVQQPLHYEDLRRQDQAADDLQY